MTLGEAAHQTLRQLQDLLAHQVADGDPAVIVERAFEVLLAQTLKKKAALTERPRARQQRQSAAAKSTPSRNIPAEVRREVWQREQGSCGFVGEDGKRCGETRGLEFAHQKPWAKGGEHSADNLALRCRTHNTLEADRDYGEAFMRKKRERGPAPVASQPKSFRVREPRVTYGRGPGRAGSARASGRAASCSRPQLTPATRVELSPGTASGSAPTTSSARSASGPLQRLASCVGHNPPRTRGAGAPLLFSGAWLMYIERPPSRHLPFRFRPPTRSTGTT